MKRLALALLALGVCGFEGCPPQGVVCEEPQPTFFCIEYFDVDDDYTVGTIDLFHVETCYANPGYIDACALADINRDGFVNELDVMMFEDAKGTCW